MRLLHAGLSVLALALIVDAGCSPSSPEPESLRQHLAATLPAPAGVGRLSDRLSWEPFQAEEPAMASFAGSDEILLEARLTEAARDGKSGQGKHALGVLRIYQGRFDQAIALLGAASSESPDDPSILSDLAAAYLAKEAGGKDLPDALLAADAATKALAITDDLPEARFNLALALGRLGLHVPEAATWNAYLDQDSRSEWADEARRRLEAIPTTSRAEAWSSIETQVRRALEIGDEREAETLISTMPFEAAHVVEEKTLGEWAKAELDGEVGQARSSLDLARSVGRVLGGRYGDRLIQEGVEAIDQARSQGGSDLVKLAEAHEALAAGIASRRSGNCEAAQPELEEAARNLQARGSSFGPLARFQASICPLFKEREATRESLLELRNEIVKKSFPRLLARVEWVLGLAETYRRDFWTALAHYRRADAAFASCRDKPGRATLLPLVSDAYRHLGEPRRAWKVRLSGIRTLSALGDFEGLDRALGEAVAALIEEHRYAPALWFQDELLAHSGETESPLVSRAVGLQLRADLLARLGRVAEALESLEGAEEAAHSLAAGSLRDRLELDLEVERASLSARRDPQQAAEMLDNVIERYRASGFAARMPELLTRRAESEEGYGDLDLANQDFSQALHLVEAQRDNSNSESVRISAFERDQEIFDAAIRFQVEARNNSLAALELADEAKSRELTAQIEAAKGMLMASGPQNDSSSGGDSRSLEAKDPRVEVPSATTLIEYHVLPDQLLIWVVRSDGLELVKRHIDAATLERHVHLFERGLENSSDEARLQGLGATLFDDLIRPIQGAIHPHDLLVFVPDRYLNRVPFGALFDRQAKRWLLEDHASLVTPSAQAFATLSNATQEREARRSALVIGSPAIDRSQFPELTDLPSSEMEARRVAALYPGSELVLGHQATASRLLESLPGKGVLHVAAHTLATNAGKARLLLSPEPDGRSDGSLSLGEIRSADLSSLRLVYLSTCSSAEVFPDGGREGLSGFARELLASGVPDVVASLWPVDDDASAALAVAFHREYRAGKGPAEALRLAELSLLHHPTISYRSPSRWSAFEVFGGAVNERP